MSDKNAKPRPSWPLRLSMLFGLVSVICLVGSIYAGESGIVPMAYCGPVLLIFGFPGLILGIVMSGGMFIWPDAIPDGVFYAGIIIPSVIFWMLAGALVGRVVNKRAGDYCEEPNLASSDAPKADAPETES